MRALAVIVLVACGSKGPPALPELDPASWKHVQELARPAGPNGPTKELDLAIDIAYRNDWASKLGDNQPLPELAEALDALRKWRTANGGIVQLPLNSRTVDRNALVLSNGIATADAPDAIALATLIGQRMFEQADSLLNGAIAVSALSKVHERAKQTGQTFLFDVAAWRRGIVRAIAGEVLWLRKQRESGTVPADQLAALDDQVRVMSDVLRKLGPSSTEQQIIDAVNAGDRRDEQSARALDVMSAMIAKWRDEAAQVFAP